MNFVFITEDVNDIFKNYYKCKYNKKGSYIKVAAFIQKH